MSLGPIREGIRRVLRLGIRRRELTQAEADAELDAVVAERADHLVARGMAPEAARAEALRLAGSDPAEASRRVRESAIRRDRRLGLIELFSEAVADVRYALRTLRRNPGLAVAAIATLALAIGINTTIYSAVEAVILRPLPFADPGRLVSLWEENPDFQWYQQDAAPANYLDWHEQLHSVQGVAAYPSFPGTVTLTGTGQPRLLQSQAVTGNFFEVLGIRPIAGRLFTGTETWLPGGTGIAVLSYRAWRDQFGADRGVVGGTVHFDGRPVQVIGVLPPDFRFPGLAVDVWVPTGWEAAARGATWFRRAHFVRTVARLKPGVTVERAEAELRALASRLERDYPATNTRMGAGLTPLHELLIGNTRRPLLVLFGAVGLLLLIACANIANLLLVRAAARGREAALRLALGAGRGRVLRQALIDSLVVAALGGATGIGLGFAGTWALGVLQPPGMLPVTGVSISWAVVGYALLVTTLSALVFGVGPALWLGRRVPADVLRDEGRTATGGRRSGRLADLFLVSQVALALVLSLGAGLLVRSYLQLGRVDPGFDSSRVLATRIVLPDVRYDSLAKVHAFFDQLLERGRALPGVELAAVASKVPLGPSSWTSEFAIQGRPPMERGAHVVHREISGDYQRVMRVPLLRGRYLTDRDRLTSERVVLVNETLAKRYFRGQDPIGQRVAFDRVPDSTSHWRTIVGVVGDERQMSLGEPVQAEFFAPYGQEDRSGMTLLLRTRGDPMSLEAAVRTVIPDLDPLLAITSITTLEDVRSASLARDRFLAALLGSFATLGFLLGLVGIYGVTAQLTRRRLREMAIRIALGARAGQVEWIAIRRGIGLTVIGVGVGLAVAFVATGALRSMLYQVAPADPLTFVVVPAVVLATALVASWLPARRAGRADPTTVLRAD